MRSSIMRFVMLLALMAAIIAITATLSSGGARSQSVEIASYSPGQTISYTGHGTPGVVVTMSASTSTSVQVSGGNYQLALGPVTVPDCSIDIYVYGVKTINFGGSTYKGAYGIGFWTPEVTGAEALSGNNVGAYSYRAGAGQYKVRVFGAAVPGATSVRVDVSVSEHVTADSSGAYTLSINTAGLPSGVYTISAGDRTVERVYLGDDGDMPYSRALDLKAGWNLVSLPVVPENSQIDYIFSPAQQQNIDVIWDYNGGDWKYWTTEPGWPDTLSSLSPSRGYYIYCYNPMTVRIYGTRPPGPVSMGSLSQGWNLVGYPGSSAASVTSVYGPADVVWKYDQGNWYYYTTEAGYADSSTLRSLEPGYGYWVYKL